MTLLFLALWLQMSAQPQISPNECGQHADGSYTDCCGELMNMPLNQVINQAADETDGKPIPKRDYQGCAFTDKRMQEKCAIEHVVDVPAVQEEVGPKHFFCEINAGSKTSTVMWLDMNGMSEHTDCGKDMHVTWTRDKQQTCADKSRILEHDENSPPKYWCRKVQP